MSAIDIAQKLVDLGQIASGVIPVAGPAISAICGAAKTILEALTTAIRQECRHTGSCKTRSGLIGGVVVAMVEQWIAVYRLTLRFCPRNAPCAVPSGSGQRYQGSNVRLSLHLWHFIEHKKF